MKTQPASWSLIYLCVGLTSLATLLFELSLTRIFSVVFYYHFAFLAISIALFGLGVGGVLSYVVAGWRAPLAYKLGGLSLANTVPDRDRSGRNSGAGEPDIAVGLRPDLLHHFAALHRLGHDSFAGGVGDYRAREPGLLLRSVRRGLRLHAALAAARIAGWPQRRDLGRRHLRGRRRHLVHAGGLACADG